MKCRKQRRSWFRNKSESASFGQGLGWNRPFPHSGRWHNSCAAEYAQGMKAWDEERVKRCCNLNSEPSGASCGKLAFSCLKRFSLRMHLNMLKFLLRRVQTRRSRGWYELRHWRNQLERIILWTKSSSAYVSLKAGLALTCSHYNIRFQCQ